MRTKCVGGNPCDKCRKDGALCAFGDRKRERNKKREKEEDQLTRFKSDFTLAVESSLPVLVLKKETREKRNKKKST